MRRLRQALWNNIFTYDARLYEEHLWNRMEDFSTIILGETGTGKTLSAAAIGRSGHIPFDERKGCFAESFARTFISINLSQYSEHLIESELFGHKKGAFTGAVEGHEGVFARCSPYGAIFLDEIGEISVPLQIKLLKVLEERTSTPVGSHDEKRFQGRVIAATNQPLTQLRRQGGFRDDFYYRLCSDIIEVPSLHTRLQEDAKEMRVMLVATLQRILGHSPRSIINELSALIEKSVPKDYRWPGNIRELEQCVRGMLLNRSYSWGTISEEVENMDEFYHGLHQGEYTANELLAKYCALLYSREGTLEKVAARVGLDRRTVRKYVDKSERQGRAPAG